MSRVLIFFVCCLFRLPIGFQAKAVSHTQQHAETLLWRRAYIAVLVVEVDDQAEGPASHWFCGDEGVLERRLSAGLNHKAQLEGCEVLDVELEILRHKTDPV